MLKEGYGCLLLQRRLRPICFLLYVGGLAIMVFMSTGFSVISFFSPVPLALSTMVLPLSVLILTPPEVTIHRLRACSGLKPMPLLEALACAPYPR